MSKDTLRGHWNCLFISSHCYTNSPRSWCMQKHPAPCQLQSIYGGQSSMESSLTLSLWIQPSGPEIRAQVADCPTTQLSASCPAPVKSRTIPEPECHDPNPQLTVCSATGREVRWHGKHSLGQERSQRIGSGSGANVAKYSTKTRNFRFFSPLLPSSSFLFCQSRSLVSIRVLKSLR